MPTARSLACVVLALAAASGQTPPKPDQQRAGVIRIDLDNSAITPVTARFIERTIGRAGEQGATALVLVLDTPGGLIDSTRGVVKSILQSKVPVVVYVAPQGARAASAGVFITMAAHVAAMAPGTTIGAAHPVAIGGLPGLPEPAPGGRDEPKTPGGAAAPPMETKVLNDTVAWARSLAELRGRNAAWMARAVTESVSVTSAEALREGVVDLLADDFESLLRSLDGRTVTLAAAEPIILRTAGAPVTVTRMWWGERVLAALANPTLAFLLLIFGVYGVIFELYSPGWGVPGTAGVICLVLGFFSLSILPVNYVGLALLIIALALLTAEVFVVSYGLLTVGGVICLVLGGLMLVDSPAGFLRVSLWALIPVAAAISLVALFLLVGVIRTQRLPALMDRLSAENLATSAEDFAAHGEHYQGFVRVHGELWRAHCPTPVMNGQTVSITRRDGLILHVEPASDRAAPVTSIHAGRRNIA